MFATLSDLQREIYARIGETLQAFAAGGGWGGLIAFLPLAILFGAVHAMTPGHSKAILATYLVGNPAGVLRGLAVSLVLSATHIGMSVAIALLALPLVSVALGSAGRAPLLEDLSRGLLGAFGLWMILRAIWPKAHAHDHGNGIAFGIMAGLVPCPLTLFVMTFAIARGVPAAGLAFAAMMMIGVALVLGTVAIASVVGRDRVSGLLTDQAVSIETVARATSAVAGSVLLAVALQTLVL